MKIFHLFFRLSLFFAVAKFGDPPRMGSVILSGTGSVFSLRPRTGKITKKCKNYYAVATLAINKYKPSAGIAPTYPKINTSATSIQ